MTPFRTALFTTALLAGCAGTNVRDDDVRRIQTGMSSADVVALVGTPDRVQGLAGGGSVYIYEYRNRITDTARTLRVEFRNGMVVAPPALPALP